MLNHDDVSFAPTKEFSPACVKAIRAMLLEGKAENDKAELLIFHGDVPSKSPVKKKS